MKDRQYKSNLTPRQAAEGIKVASDNAKKLYQDAQLLFDNNRYERAVALAILAIEEAGKIKIIRGILTEDDPGALKKKWQSYRRHTDKNIMWIFPQLVAGGARKLQDFLPIFDSNKDHPQTLENIKQLSFYTDFFTNLKWNIPSETITKDIVKSIMRVAEIMVQSTEGAMTSEKELELWLKHMKPTKDKDFHNAQQAMINCYREAEELGLIEAGMADKMENFIYKQGSH